MILKVATYNIHKSVGRDGRRRPDRIFRVLCELDADVVALQEVDRRFGGRASTFEAEKLEHETGFHLLRLAASPHSSGWHGNAILVRTPPVHATEAQRLSLPSLEARGALLADLTVNGFEVRIIAAHFGLLGRYRRRQAEAVLSHLHREAPRPTVMMGDLNEWSPRGGCLRVLGETFEVAAPGPSFPAHSPVLALDRVLATGGAELVSARVHESELAQHASDHLPVTAEIRLAEAVAQRASA